MHSLRKVLSSQDVIFNNTTLIISFNIFMNKTFLIEAPESPSQL